MDLADRLIGALDNALRTLAGAQAAGRPSPAESVPEAELSAEERSHAAALMRVNRAGEICAQALYQGQALAARDPALARALERAAAEERDHLAWCDARIRELGGRPSLLDPLWYAGALAIGLAAGAAGERWSLGFLAETERQVEEHLEGHLARLAPADLRTRAVISRMQAEERGHRERAIALGAAELPAPVQAAMRAAARVMTTVAYRL